MSRVFTIGHGTRTTDELVAVLASAGVGRVFDVRRFPGSRRNPHFSREALESSMPQRGIRYEWWGEDLGGRRKSPSLQASRHVAWKNAAFQGYADYMDTERFREALAQLEDAAQAEPPLAIMCAETLWWHCHRRLIADALHLRGAEVIHLIATGESQRHKPHPDMRADEQRRPVYDVGATGRLEL
jgi:uncharacterized protein (DUF488 family)